MKSRLNYLLAVSLLVSAYQPLIGQTATQSQRQDPVRIRIGTAEVALDVVVRDKRGRPVRDLTAADFEIYEDGVRQEIESFRLVSREAGAKNNTDRAKESATTTAARGNVAIPGVVALVFDRLSPEARGLVRRTATAYADEGLMANDYTGVFAIDLSVHTLQAYTDNAQLVKQAIEQATARSVSTFVSSTDRVRTLAGRSAALERQGETAQAAAAAAGSGRDSGGASASGGISGQAIVDQAMVQMEMRMLETFEALERNQQGYATINGLLSLVN